MSLDLLSLVLGGFSVDSTLLLRSLEGFYLSGSSTPSVFRGFDFPLTCSINKRILTAVIDQ
jgi:hypothetical protein